MNMHFTSKADTLAELEGKLKYACVLPQFSFTSKMWNEIYNDIDILWNEIPQWANTSLIVRSSARAEDSSKESLAGHYTTVANVNSKSQLKSAVTKVYKSFNDDMPQNQIFIQPMLENILISGVAFTRDPSNGSYYSIINFDDKSGDTDTVTSGTSNSLKVYYHSENAPLPKENWMSQLLLLLKELKDYFKNDALDIEFAFDQSGTLFLFQVRKLIMQCECRISVDEHTNLLSEIETRYNSLSKYHPYLLGRKTIFGVMPDWNPAEIIGVRPRPLALSLYKELITDGTWAYQRDNYGYRNLRSFPLLVSFGGLPYIDVRISFNSFIPSDLKDGLAERLVNFYLDSLLKNPSKHDKVEFDILYSCYTLDLPQRIDKLKNAGFKQTECDEIIESLKRLTNKIIDNDDGLWKKDIGKLETLKDKQKIINTSNLAPIEKIYWLLEDCKRYGTLPFAGLARAGFIAVQLLQSLVRVGVLTAYEYESFLESLSTVNSDMQLELRKGKNQFLKKYGHLRPGTYNILSHRYDETPDMYFDWSEYSVSQTTDKSSKSFSLSLNATNRLKDMLKDQGVDHNVQSLFYFIRGAIEGREYAKFIFTKSLSDALLLIEDMGKEFNVDVDALSYMDINIIKKLYSSSDNAKEIMKNSIEAGMHMYTKSCALTLPPLITSETEIRAFELPSNEPNYITMKSTKGTLVFEGCNKKDLIGNILMIPSADPGFDWVFSHKIKGFITMYGGANSHMAIRAGELGIPAVIGAGEVFYKKWSMAKIIEIDCANKKVLILK
ncbi:PEP/pyruvate-binding domain-containing protein [Alphaproteobacteria bacterium]|nr:PEP-utilizing enzyme [Alphaproteobacteria bacterium]MDC1023086.1 PEP/pyruvate-binding domain-containing protein [Alphaproteobacteria bacterium]